MFTTLFRTVTIRTVTLLAVSLCAASQVFAANYVSVSSDSVNVRTGPGTSYQVAMELFKGYPLEVVESKGEWVKVSDFEKDTGWIHNSLVVTGNTVIVNSTKSVNMRSEPTTKSSIIANVDRGVVLTKLESRGKWLKLKHSSGLIGWIYKPLLWP